MGLCRGTETEIRGIFKVISDHDLANGDIEWDSEEAIRMIKDGLPPDSPFKLLEEQCKALKTRNRCIRFFFPF